MIHSGYARNVEHDAVARKFKVERAPNGTGAETAFAKQPDGSFDAGRGGFHRRRLPSTVTATPTFYDDDVQRLVSGLDTGYDRELGVAADQSPLCSWSTFRPH